jgi:hypothetical protein
LVGDQDCENAYKAAKDEIQAEFTPEYFGFDPFKGVVVVNADWYNTF